MMVFPTAESKFGSTLINKSINALSCSEYTPIYFQGTVAIRHVLSHTHTRARARAHTRTSSLCVYIIKLGEVQMSHNSIIIISKTILVAYLGIRLRHA